MSHEVEGEETRIVSQRRSWPSLLHGVGLGVGMAALVDVASELLPLLDAITRGTPGLVVGAGLAAAIGFFFETTPPRSGSKDREKDEPSNGSSRGCH